MQDCIVPTLKIQYHNDNARPDNSPFSNFAFACWFCPFNFHFPKTQQQYNGNTKHRGATLAFVFSYEHNYKHITIINIIIICSLCFLFYVPCLLIIKVWTFPLHTHTHTGARTTIIIMNDLYVRASEKFIFRLIYSSVMLQATKAYQ